MFSIGEMRWRLLRKFLRMPGYTAKFSEIRSYCRYEKDVSVFHDLVRIGCLRVVSPHSDKKVEGTWQLTPRGIEVSDMGEVDWPTYQLLTTPPPVPKKRKKVKAA
jgi:hypothetical protein